MTWDRRQRKYWDVGDSEVFRMSKDRCQKLVQALVLCDGKVHDCHSLDVHDGAITHGMKPHQAAVLFRISLPEGAESLFESILGPNTLEEPPRIQGN